MIIYVDIDNTICDTNKTYYENAIPDYNKINHINNLYDKGHEIIYWTARGSKTGKDWKLLTEMQLKKWGAKYTELKLDKPAFDLFIDDKSINSYTYFKEMLNEKEKTNKKT